MSSSPLKVLAVADDRNILRHLSRFLNVFGYQVEQVTEKQQALAALAGEAADFLIVDSEPATGEALELCRSASEGEQAGYVYKFLLIGERGPQDLAQAIAAGVDDFLAKPIVYGELLARLRAGARVLEFERRVRRQAGVEPLTGLASRTAFCDRLRRRLSADENAAGAAACVLLDIDFLQRINCEHGRPAGDTVISAAADKLRDLCDDSELVSSFGSGRFCIWLPGLCDVEAAAWADRQRRALAEMTVMLGEKSLQLTASFGIAGQGDGLCTPEEIIDRAAEALQAAKRSGRNCVVRFGEFDDHAKAWADFAAPGKLFERTTARDVMTPCPLVLRPDHTVARAARLFRQTGVSALPVVDSEGKLAGLAFDQSVLCGPSGNGLASLRICDVMTTDVPSYDDDTSFATLKDFFTRDSRPLVVIVCDGSPVGLVRPDNLASLSQPITPDTFASAVPYSGSSRYLLVPDLCLLEGTQ